MAQQLIWGDKKYVLPSLLAEFAGKVNLIYVDPPFDTGADFSFTARIPENPETEDQPFTFTKEPSIIEQKAYRDTWGRGLESYLQWFFETIEILREFLDENGTIYVHLDWHVSFYAKAILDEVFGGDRFVNEIVWKRQTAKGDVTQGAMHMGRLHESIFIYTKSDSYTWNMQYVPYDDKYLETHYRGIEPDTKRRFELADLNAPGGAAKGNPYYEFLGVKRYWRYKRERMEELHKAGRIVQPSPGAVARFKRYLDEMPGLPVQDVWTDINAINSQATEAAGYATQKPESLLGRILKLSSNEDDIVFDCFVGSGTAEAVAEKLKRRWVACDLSRFAVHTTRKRLLSIPGVRPFAVENLGKYERQLWAETEFGDNALPLRSGGSAGTAGEGARRGTPPSTAFGGPLPRAAGEDRWQSGSAPMRRKRVEFILKLAGARSISGYTWLHGVRAGRMIHVGAVDAPVSVGDVTQIAVEFRRAVGTVKDAPKANGVDLLGWDFGFEVNEVGRQQAAEANIQMRFLRIPRDVMDKRAVAEGEIQFFELPALSVDLEANKRNVSLKLTDFVIPPDDVPEEVRRAVRHWSQWIDYWAVDWDNKGDTFHNEWQTYRTRRNKSLALETAHTYADADEYTVVVKVIDIVGNDTTRTVKVRVA